MYYKTQKEKAHYFQLKKVDTESQLINVIDFIGKQSKCIWRGANDASFKNYTSLQRINFSTKKYNTVKDVINYIGQLDKQFDNWNNGLFKKYYDNYKINRIPLYAKLSILRHYGVPSPILDWTKNPFIALFFAIHESKSSFKFGINKYISLNCLTSLHPFNSDIKFKLAEHAKTLDSYQEGLKGRLKIMSPICGEEMLEVVKSNFHKEYCQSSFNGYDYIIHGLDLFPIQKIDDDINDDPYIHYINNNYNITSQEGLFMLNIYPNYPLEKAIFERTKERIKDNNDELMKSLELSWTNFICFDISKKMIPKIKELLDSKGINENYVYPKLERLKCEIK